MPISTSDRNIRASQIKDLAKAHDFDLCYIGSASLPWQAGKYLSEFIEANHHGEMEWMAREQHRRSHPQNMWPEARSAIMLGINYGPELDPLSGLEDRSRAVISCYAQGDDYHKVIKKRLKAMARDIVSQSHADVKVFIDTAPLMEKPLAQRAGLGWQGKHTNLVNQEFGSWLFLGVILTDQILDYDPPETDHCGSCSACIDICPTRAIIAPYKLDARLCISYLTIEHKGMIPRALRAQMGNRIYGCDDCLAICPWNKFAQGSKHIKLKAKGDRINPPLDELLELDEAAFRARFRASPIKRIGWIRFMRNILMAIGNAKDDSFVPKLINLLGDDNAIIRASAIWALSRLDTDRFEAEKSARQFKEKHPIVLEEWVID